MHPGVYRMNGFSHRKTNAERRGGEGKEKEKVKKGGGGWGRFNEPVFYAEKYIRGFLEHLGGPSLWSCPYLRYWLGEIGGEQIPMEMRCVEGREGGGRNGVGFFFFAKRGVRAMS